jgi:hypothetical protein
VSDSGDDTDEMFVNRTPRVPRIDDETAEALLAGRAVDPAFDDLAAAVHEVRSVTATPPPAPSAALAGLLAHGAAGVGLSSESDPARRRPVAPIVLLSGRRFRLGTAGKAAIGAGIATVVAVSGAAASGNLPGVPEPVALFAPAVADDATGTSDDVPGGGGRQVSALARAMAAQLGNPDRPDVPDVDGGPTTEPSVTVPGTPADPSRPSGTPPEVDTPSVTAPGRPTELPSDTAPGRGEESPSGTAPGQGEESPSDTAPGQGEQSPSDTAPGQGEESPSDTAPGQGEESPSGTAPSRPEDTPGDSAPGSPGDDDTPGDTAPGRGGSPADTRPSAPGRG